MNRKDFTHPGDKIRKMKNPAILMNRKDFEILSKKIDTEHKAEDFIFFNEIPIKFSDAVKKGIVIVYDDSEFQKCPNFTPVFGVINILDIHKIMRKCFK